MALFINLDESGSYHSLNERFYVIAGFVCHNQEQVIKIHEKVSQQVIANKKSYRNKELKAANIKTSERALFINELLSIDEVTIVGIIVDKKQIDHFKKLKITETMAYNFFVKELISFLIYDGVILSDDNNLIIHLDYKALDEKIYDDLESYLNLEFLDTKNIIEVEYLDSISNREIQLADYIANMLYGEYNQTNNTLSYIKNLYKIKCVQYP